MIKPFKAFVQIVFVCVCVCGGGATVRLDKYEYVFIFTVYLYNFGDAAYVLYNCFHMGKLPLLILQKVRF